MMIQTWLDHILILCIGDCDAGPLRFLKLFILEVPLIFLFIQFLVIVNLRELKLGGIHTLLLNTDPR